MVTIIEDPQPPAPDVLNIILTILVEVIQTLIEARVITKRDARDMFEAAAAKLSRDKKAVGPRNARFVLQLARAYFK